MSAPSLGQRKSEKERRQELQQYLQSRVERWLQLHEENPREYPSLERLVADLLNLDLGLNLNPDDPVWSAEELNHYLWGNGLNEQLEVELKQLSPQERESLELNQVLLYVAPSES